ncbi:uncharacterized protein N0V89_001687 [Didymosphaeria variabile]|uniref:Uncharacterized protein n=1 Tax=Didymosphaeria variabile TaxID=1932322 RepID=A0A9W8XXN3_9PLEO|nr:uncharacterized protein N0V89_001687 [Didymosphaeria variabile]KAJ4361118.1 hypothetical protein N0V89_001687 [Didymosphaeria variabile]
MGPAVYSADETEKYRPDALTASDPVLYLHRNTYPGCRLPHAWLNTAAPSAPISTIDLAGHGGFTLLTGIGGDAWKPAVGEVSRTLRVPIVAYSIGFRQEWEDVYFEWEKVRGVEESGAILIRPDRFVAWRSQKAYGDVDECAGHLTKVMRSLLGLTKGDIAKTVST